jgi:hypothetical protein
MEPIMTNDAKRSPRRAMVVDVHIELDDRGVYCATSEVFPEIVLCHSSLDAIKRDVPDVIEELAKRLFRTDVVVVETDPEPKTALVPWWIAIPKDILNRASKHEAGSVYGDDD